MKFRKIDEKTVCCMLSESDLTDNDITIEDFIHNREKVQNFLEAIIETAREEVGFEASGPMLSIQIMAAYPDGVMITFSEDPKDMTNAIKAGLAQAKGELDDEQWVESASDISELMESTKKEKASQVTIFEFENMKDILRFVENAPVRSGLESGLYKNEKTGHYYMTLIKLRMSEERYRTVVSTAIEFADIVGTSHLQKAWIEEHCRCVIHDRAVNTLKKVCK